jgi:hypothetical protein
MLSKSISGLSAALLCVLIIGSLLGCTAVSSGSGSMATPTVAVCQPSQIQTSETGFSEIQGTMQSDGEIWALLFFGKAYATEEVKIVWRITGTDEPFTVQGRHEDGTVISPIWGPEAHAGSNWDRPGDEWGTGFKFPKSGCWTLIARRGTTIGEIGLDVSP